jgi:hypothetical protein
VAYYLLRQAAGVCKVMYLMRTTPRDMICDLLGRFDDKVRGTFEELMGRGLTYFEWAQAELPIKRGGAGLRRAAEGADAAYIASRNLTAEACKKLCPEFVDDGLAAAEVQVGLGGAVTRVNRKLPPDKQIGISMEAVRAAPRKLQQEVDEETQAALLRQSNEWDRARMRGVSAAHAGSWLEGAPAKALGLQLSSEEFRSRMGRRLGCELCAEGPCPLCFQVMDRFGSHAEGCMSGGDAVLRHNQNRDTIHSQCKAAGTRPELEKAKVLAGIVQERDLNGRRPADTLLSSCGGGKNCTRTKIAKGGVGHWLCQSASGGAPRSGGG